MQTAKDVFHYIRLRLELGVPEQELYAIVYRLMDAKYDLERKDIISEKRIQLNPDEYEELDEIIRRLNQEEPLQYILATEEFYGLAFKVSPDVLIPRPETEELVDLIIRDNKIENHIILDIGTGSGCIAVTLAKNFKNAEVYAIDVSEKALEIAKENSRRHHVPVNFLLVDILGSFPPTLPYNLIVSNPPYVTEAEKKLMRNNVLNHEPHLALFIPDHNPLLFYKRITEVASQQLVQGGKLYFEINENFGQQVKEMMEASHFTDVEIIQDLQGKDRIARGQKL